MVAKSFPRKQVWSKNFHKNLFGRKIFIVAKSFPRKQVWTRNFHQKYLVENFLWLQNHFHDNRFEPKIFIRNVLCRKCFMVAKSFPWKQVPTKNVHQNIFVGIFLWFQIISSKTGLHPKFSSKNVWLKIFYVC